MTATKTAEWVTPPVLNHAAHIVAAIMTVPQPHRLDALALAIRVAIDKRIVLAPWEIP